MASGTYYIRALAEPDNDNFDLDEVQMANILCNKPIAHVAEDGRCHLLQEHLTSTARRSSEFAGQFGAAGWGRMGYSDTTSEGSL